MVSSMRRTLGTEKFDQMVAPQRLRLPANMSAIPLGWCAVLLAAGFGWRGLRLGSGNVHPPPRQSQSFIYRTIMTKIRKKNQAEGDDEEHLWLQQVRPLSR